MSEQYTRNGNAVINQNDTEYQNYLAQRARLKATKSESDSIKDRIAKLESDVSEMKQLIMRLVNG